MPVDLVLRVTATVTQPALRLARLLRFSTAPILTAAGLVQLGMEFDQLAPIAGEVHPHRSHGQHLVTVRAGRECLTQRKTFAGMLLVFPAFFNGSPRP